MSRGSASAPGPRDNMPGASTPSPPPPPTTAAAFAAQVDALLAASPSPSASADRPEDTVRTLLRGLAALQEQLPLRVSARLFTLLARPALLSALVAFLPCDAHGGLAAASDLDVNTAPNDDARRSKPYPFLVSRILAYGSQALRSNIVADPTLLSRVVASLLPPRDHVTASHITQVLESFLESAPLAVISAFAKTPSPYQHSVASSSPSSSSAADLAEPPASPAPDRQPFLPALLSHSLHVPAVADLLVALVPSPSAQPLAGADAARAHAWAAARLLAESALMSALPTAFARASANVLQNRVSVQTPPPQTAYDDVRRLQGAADVLAGVVERMLPVWRRLPLDAGEEGFAEATEACRGLNVYETPSAAAALAILLDAGIQTLTSSNFTCTDGYHAAIKCCVAVLDALVAERERPDGSRPLSSRTGNVPLRCPALDEVIIPRLPSIIEILVDTAPPTLHGFEACRVKTFDLFVALQRASSPAVLYPALDRVRFGEVALKLVRVHSMNSILHNIVATSVQVALVSDVACLESRTHWLQRSKLVDKIMASWARDGGVLNWTDPAAVQRAPYLSAIVHMACCVRHLRAMDCAAVETLVSGECLLAFDAFCGGPLTTILADETQLLGGTHPPRRRSDRLGGVGRSPFGGGSLEMRRSNTGSSLLRSAASRVNSPCAHRFGFVTPSQSHAQGPRSRLGNVFATRSSIDTDDWRATDSENAASDPADGSADSSGSTASLENIEDGVDSFGSATSRTDTSSDPSASGTSLSQLGARLRASRGLCLGHGFDDDDNMHAEDDSDDDDFGAMLMTASAT